MIHFENRVTQKMLEQAQTFFGLLYLFVTSRGFEPPTLRAEI